MSVESDLKKDGIEVIKKLDDRKVDSIASKVSDEICRTFPEYGLNVFNLYARLSTIDMYIANMPDGMSEANYFYKNKSIYFNSHIHEEDLEKFAVHECIHFIQERKDKKEHLLRMGLCDYSDFRICGLGLNEASVQLMTSKILGNKKETVKYFGVSFDTISPSYYPVECCLASEMAYIVGEDILFESTINSNDNFKLKFIKMTDHKTFSTVQDNIDKIMKYEEKIVKINNKIVQISDRNKKVDNMIEKINNLKDDISSTFIDTQNLIITSYFDKALYNINEVDQIEEYRKKLYNFKDYLGATDGYTFFNDYYVDKMMELEDKYDLLENHVTSPTTALVAQKSSKIAILFRYIRKLFTVRKLDANVADEKDRNH